MFLQTVLQLLFDPVLFRQWCVLHANQEEADENRDDAMSDDELEVSSFNFANTQDVLGSRPRKEQSSTERCQCRGRRQWSR